MPLSSLVEWEYCSGKDAVISTRNVALIFRFETTSFSMISREKQLNFEHVIPEFPSDVKEIGVVGNRDAIEHIGSVILDQPR